MILGQQTFYVKGQLPHIFVFQGYTICDNCSTLPPDAKAATICYNVWLYHNKTVFKRREVTSGPRPRICGPGLAPCALGGELSLLSHGWEFILRKVRRLLACQVSGGAQAGHPGVSNPRDHVFVTDEQDAVNSLSWIQEMLASKDRRPRVVSLRRLLEVLTPSLAS